MHHVFRRGPVLYIAKEMINKFTLSLFAEGSVPCNAFLVLHLLQDSNVQRDDDDQK